ncbi:MAG: cellulase family glycosylhydrolase [Bryobacteraceae bacterium]|jgi:endoglucanase
MRTTSALCAISRRAGGIAALIVMIAGTAAGQYLRGVNVSQAEWGDPLNLTEGPGNYAYATAPTFNYFAARALPFIRLQVKWERLQPTLGGPLNSDQLTYLQNDVAYAKAAGALVSIVPHNEARYATLESQVANYDSDACIVDNPCPGSPVLVTSDDLVDFWVKMSNVFVNDPTVIAYDLTNEPHDMGVANWSQIAQKVLTAIRANGDNKTIMIPGDGWSNATYWTTYNGAAPFITDPANNYYYEAHLYFDSDFSGSYAETYDQELAANPQLADVGATRLLPFANWCAANNVPCYLGEYGIPSNDARWLTVLNNFLNTLDIAKMPGTYWAAGELWATVPTCSCSLLSVQPSNNFTTDAEQLPTLLGHLPPNTVRTASAAASYGWASAPGELVALYGSGLATGTGVATELPLSTDLEGAQVQLTDSTGNVSLSPLLYVSPTQINYQIPSSGVAAGLANVAVLNGTTTVATGLLEVSSIAPTIFTANSTGQGVPAAQIQRVHPDGSYDYEDVFSYDASSSQFVPSPIAFNGDNLYLLLYGTGFDTASAGGTNVSLSTPLAGFTLSILFSGAQGQYAGLDQIVAPLPASLAGSGQLTVNVTVSGSTANPVTIAFQ